MAYRGNKLQFGKLLMSDTDLVLIDPAPKDPFDFYLDRYKDQLVAGYSKTTPTFGLNVYMVDFNKLKKSPAPPKRPKRRNKRCFADGKWLKALRKYLARPPSRGRSYTAGALYACFVVDSSSETQA